MSGDVHVRFCESLRGWFPWATRLVVCFQQGSDAQRFRMELEQRLGLFGLEVAAEKTKVLEFGPFATSKAKARGEKPQTFDFLGLTHYCSRTRDGKRFRMKRLTSRKKFRAKLLTFKEWLKANRTTPAPELMKTVVANVRGHIAYYGVTDNSLGIGRYVHEVSKLLFKWLNRRGKRGSLTLEKFKRFLNRFPLPRPLIRVNLLTSK